MNDIKVGDKIRDTPNGYAKVLEITTLTFGGMKILGFVLSNGRTILYDEAVKCKIQ